MADIDLYKVDTGPPIPYCGGNTDTDGSQESCVTVGPIIGAPGAVALGDSKQPDRAPLRFDANEVEAFVRGYATEHGITL